MRLLVVTQVVDADDLFLGFFHLWIEDLAKHFEHIEVVCLKEGRHDFPANVSVHSLGKERGAASRAAYALRFLSLAWRLRRGYDAVFVHMNQEYILIAGWLWKLMGKRIYLWRNHYAGSFLTDIAAAFCTNVFCTSKHSYTAKYKKTVIMPVGVNTERFFPEAGIPPAPRSILFFARMAPSKRPDMLVEALGVLHGKGIDFTADFYGTPLPEHEAFEESVKERVRALGLSDSVRFFPGVSNEEAPQIFAAHAIFVNCASSGMYDKMLFEAAASGCLVLAASADFAGATSEQFHFTDAGNLSEKLEAALSMPAETQESARAMLQDLARKNALPNLMSALARVMQGS